MQRQQRVLQLQIRQQRTETGNSGVDHLHLQPRPRLKQLLQLRAERLRFIHLRRQHGLVTQAQHAVNTKWFRHDQLTAAQAETVRRHFHRGVRVRICRDQRLERLELMMRRPGACLQRLFIIRLDRRLSEIDAVTAQDNLQRTQQQHDRQERTKDVLQEDQRSANHPGDSSMLGAAALQRKRRIVVRLNEPNNTHSRGRFLTGGYQRSIVSEPSPAESQNTSRGAWSGECVVLLSRIRDNPQTGYRIMIVSQCNTCCVLIHIIALTLPRTRRTESP